MKQLTASMAGTVLNIAVNEGDSVSAGQTVMTLESMKMEIPVEAEFGGQVEKIDVEVGGFVNEGDTLVTLGE
ncbi:acetyl-CoA carboxylase biotin carboxyl carrier protein subunit [Planococcus maritimus]|uniref:Acetyl-CoA carboxylase biotin carboxyl carrier protein subunit n=1 Tax=Planococcus maritimus TaxID=192421 RepID=A0A150W7W4_PLAMR|nr:acetyl-CoA carboxylase biotin carboxyl carrier protein subunit [Planococcus maritimus]ANU17543.1 acetyl-CoA carboxylase biotin carboxyl carrier protein subunit [Planococcus maritimus]KYG59059.1 acetyl-CoA carboxylase biotin carboxyl carrier protein subunit [Planococcus maritimus]OED32764.1 acetyl-CoA carboxylase biotin carboxyl carrier protein subunit [Planococcus maritimus]QMT16386.1 acetyl-CoA carboxylase biotin carboxyl carrier protein subunit [Planococcus maritimus]